MNMQSNRRQFLLGTAALFGVAGLSKCGADEIARRTGKPRAVVLFYADDLGYGDTACYGQARVPTPNLNRLASEGCRFTDAHSPAAVCTPSRYSILTGEYAFRHPNIRILDGDAAMILPPDTLASLMQNAGYRTAAIGKWHLGVGDGSGPIDWNKHIAPGPKERGFDYSFVMAATADRVPTVFIRNGDVVGLDPADPIEVCYSKNEKVWDDEVTARTNPELLKAWGRPSDHQHDKTIIDGISRIGHMRGGKAACWHDQDISDTLAAEADNFIKNSAAENKPIFMYFCTSDVHVPRDPHQRFRGKTDLGIRGDVTVQMDDCLGRVRASLAANGYEDCLFIFTSDNGPYVPDGYEDGARECWKDVNPAAPFSGGKYGPYEGGTRVPFVAAWPGVIKPGTESSALISQTDLYSTLAEIVGQRIEAHPDSQNIAAALLDGSANGRTDLVEQPGWGAFGFRQGNWKLVSREKPELFNLAEDPGEKHNLAAQYPERVQAMQRALSAIVSGK